MRKILSCLLFVCFLAVSVHAGEMVEIDLRDGSVIKGELVSLLNGVYTVKSPSAGLLRIPESRIRAITTVIAPIPPDTKRSGAKPNGQAAQNTDRSQGLSPARNDQINAIQQSMMNDKATRDKVLSLQDDPQVQKLLQDPQVLDALRSGDQSRLIGDPRIIDLLKNPAIQNVIKSMSK